MRRLRGARAMRGGVQPPLSIEITSVEPFTVQALRNVGDYAALNRAFERL